MAERVVSAAGDNVAHGEVLDAIDELIDHSLIELDRSHSDDESTRIRMLETIREYALAVLNETGELEAASHAHANGVLGFVEELEPQLESGQQALALSKLSRDQANIAAALGFLIGTPDPADHELAVRMAGSLWRYWWMRGHYSEGRRLIDSALASSMSASEHRIRALNGAGVMAFSTGDLQGAEALHSAAVSLSTELGLNGELARSRDNLGIVFLTSGSIDAAINEFESALHLYRSRDDRRGVTLALEHLAAATISRGDLERAGELARESLAARRTLGDQRLIGYSLQQLGIIAMYLGQYNEARDYYSQAQALAESLEDLTGLANTLLNLASATEMLGEYDDARQLLHRSLQIYQQLEDAGGIGFTHYLLGHVARSNGQADEAAELLTTALGQLLDVGELDSVAECLEALAGTQIDRGDLETAARMLGATQEIRDTTGAPVPGPRAAELARDLAALEDRLDGARFHSLFTAGRQMQAREFLKVSSESNTR
jgi:tetratricopeptide (TPR) repeat protein